MVTRNVVLLSVDLFQLGQRVSHPRQRDKGIVRNVEDGELLQFSNLFGKLAHAIVGQVEF